MVFFLYGRFSVWLVGVLHPCYSKWAPQTMASEPARKAGGSGSAQTAKCTVKLEDPILGCKWLWGPKADKERREATVSDCPGPRTHRDSNVAQRLRSFGIKCWLTDLVSFLLLTGVLLTTVASFLPASSMPRSFCFLTAVLAPGPAFWCEDHPNEARLRQVGTHIPLILRLPFEYSLNILSTFI